ncbi:hypothetical protein ACVDG3_08800 [Meridianimarinicoccus sp. RP-17]|uniref:hypothetical protein n=1 Tax=Meridianimarinicoccus zhengii TaxID=2056810 RepID=UPI000DAC6B55|nr:hypothetical protein [Phycocomes zhengii]
MNQDTQRYYDAAAKVLDGRDPIADRGEIMVTLEGAVTAVLLMVMNGDPRKAAGMLNEGLVQGVEGRLALWASRKQAKETP